MSKTNKINEFQSQLTDVGYICERSLASSLVLMKSLQRPILLEGEAGVGKTEISRALSEVFDCKLIRLQCYEGLDVNTAVYEWNYQRQMLAVKLLEQSEEQIDKTEQEIFSKKYLLERPLLKAITQQKPPVLLIDEIDRADEEFEAYLLEVLSDFQISIPELGTIEATSKPYVILTSNGTRELSDALRRRCLYHYVDYPDFARELRIVNTRVPDIGLQLSRQVVGFVQNLRRIDLQKNPGVAETLDWAASLLSLDISSLDDDIEAIKDSLVCLLKTREDSEALGSMEIERLVAKVI
ncbi:MoxR family ATPase [Cocleimonas sp. KMM 6892]|uniref:AAA family ATPase n=1 Tax=unclassified Cocleimonas TaxID=2639732 RepID=UPI002DBFB8EA|nr:MULTISPECIES: MoxR family ATPase [unclassified Cocleimonas]MEB8432636.1 MoxR family ATPase [Cocleimonas sp. KMM 6892]MEC4715495.1 MoxR family ATPase [Cocleimonas sp. KMM 6895]MEC4744887.1 MoxR family ATPase [Cocleimonas sp. KMM 6896]